MSVQLILYPQIEFNQEFMTDGIDFSLIDFASNYDTTAAPPIYSDILTNASYSNPGSWRRFRQTSNGKKRRKLR